MCPLTVGLRSARGGFGYARHRAAALEDRALVDDQPGRSDGAGKPPGRADLDPSGRSDVGRHLSLDHDLVGENLGMDPVVVLVPGHAYVGVRTAPTGDRYLYLDTALTGRATFEAAVQSAETGMARTIPS